MPQELLHSNWIFTNNYGRHNEDGVTQPTKDQVSDFWAALCNLATYAIGGWEVAPDTGQPHLQGYVFYTNKKSRSQVARDIPNAYIDMRKGTHEQARAYSIKDGMYEERGERPLDMAERQKKGGEEVAHVLGRAVNLVRHQLIQRGLSFLARFALLDSKQVGHALNRVA